MALESNFQKNLIKEIGSRFEDSVILKNDSGYKQGIPDLSVFYKNHWAWLEVKKNRIEMEKSLKRNEKQAYYINMAARMSFGSYIYPENKEEVLNAMERAWKGP